MPMKKCPDCGTEVSDKALSCPQCGMAAPGCLLSANPLRIVFLIGVVLGTPVFVLFGAELSQALFMAVLVATGVCGMMYLVARLAGRVDT